MTHKEAVDFVNSIKSASAIIGEKPESFLKSYLIFNRDKVELVNEAITKHAEFIDADFENRAILMGHCVYTDENGNTHVKII